MKRLPLLVTLTALSLFPALAHAKGAKRIRLSIETVAETQPPVRRGRSSKVGRDASGSGTLVRSVSAVVERPALGRRLLPALETVCSVAELRIPFGADVADVDRNPMRVSPAPGTDRVLLPMHISPGVPRLTRSTYGILLAEGVPAPAARLGFSADLGEEPTDRIASVHISNSHSLHLGPAEPKQPYHSVTVEARNTRGTTWEAYVDLTVPGDLATPPAYIKQLAEEGFVDPVERGLLLRALGRFRTGRIRSLTREVQLKLGLAKLRWEGNSSSFRLHVPLGPGVARQLRFLGMQTQLLFALERASHLDFFARRR
jgi:hypothetical protein